MKMLTYVAVDIVDRHVQAHYSFGNLPAAPERQVISQTSKAGKIVNGIKLPT